MLYRRLRYYIRLYWAFIQKFRLQILLGTLVTILILNLPPKIWQFFPHLRHTQNIGLVGRYNITNLPLTLQKKLSLGLTTLDQKGQALPGLAQSWEATNSGLLYTFHLFPNIYWSNGKKISTKDLNLKFSNAQVTTPNDLTIQIKLDKDPFSPLPVLLSKPLFQKIPPVWPKNIPIMGAGSYKLSYFRQKSDTLSEVVLTPVNSKSTLPNLRYRFYPNQQAASTAFKLGEIKVIEDFQDPSMLNSWKKVTFSPTPQFDKIVTLVFNNSGKYFAGSNGRNFRQSLAYGIDKSTYSYTTQGPIPPSSWAYSPTAKSPNYDPDKAALLFKKVTNPPSELTLYTFPAFLVTAEKIKQDIEKIGLKLNVASVTEIPADFELMLMTLPLLPDPDQYHLWHSKSDTQNYARFNNPRIDKLLEDGRREQNSDKRKSIYIDFQKYLLEEIPAVFLYFPTSYTVSRS